MLEKPRILAAVVLTAVMIFALSAVSPAQTQKPDPLLGTWDVKTEDAARELVFEFSMKDGKLVGKYTGSSGTFEMADLTFADNTVKFSVTVGNGMVIDFSAIVAEDKLSGTLSLEYGETSITGSRRK